MALTLRAVLMTAVPTLAMLLGLFWFKKKKRPPSIEAGSEQVGGEQTASTGRQGESPPRVILTQPSDEGKKVTELVSAEVNLTGISEDGAEDLTTGSELKSEDQTTTKEPESGDNTAAEMSSVPSKSSSEIKTSQTNTGDVVEERIEPVESKVVSAQQVDKPVTILKRKPLKSTDHIEQVITPSETHKLDKSCLQRNQSESTTVISVDENKPRSDLSSSTTVVKTTVLQDIGNKQQAGNKNSDNNSKSTEDSGKISKVSEDGVKISKVSEDGVKISSDNNIKSVEDSVKSKDNIDIKSVEDSIVTGDDSKIQTDQSQQRKDSEIQTDQSRQRKESEGSRKRKWSDDANWDTEDSMTPTAASPVDHGSASTNGSETSQSRSDSRDIHEPSLELTSYRRSNISKTSVDSGIVAVASPKTTEVKYEFNFPTELCGLLIGARGKNIKRVMDQTLVQIVVKKKVYDPAHQLVQVEGTQTAVDRAMDIFRKKFPPKKFPMVDLNPAPPENPVLLPEIMQLNLPEGVAIDAIVSSVVTPNHLFVQQPTHPTFPMLEKQNTVMNLCYSQDGIVPQLPRPVEVGVICAAPMFNGWYRSQVVQTYSDSDEVDLRFVDYGGYCREPASALRQIRSDFTTLPFQAVECYLANVIPPKDLSAFPQEANAVLEQMVHGQVAQVEVVGHEEDGVPYINLYIIRGNKLTLVNRELVDQGVAMWMEAY